MKLNLIILFFLILVNIKNVFSHNSSKDSLYVRIDKLKPEQKIISIHKGNIFHFNTTIKSKYKNFGGFLGIDCGLIEVNKKLVAKSKIISFEELNKLLNGEFLNIYLNYKIFFVLTSDQNNFITVLLQPILPPELNKM